MSVKLANVTLNRRGFMKSAAVVGGVAATTAFTPQVEAAKHIEVEQKPEGKLGYRETPHIREYYQKARF